MKTGLPMDMAYLLRALFLTCLIGFAAGTAVGTAVATSMTVAMVTPASHDMPGGDMPGCDMPGCDMPDCDMPDCDMPDCDMPDCAGGKAAGAGMMACDLLCATVIAGVMPQASMIAAFQSVASLEPLALILPEESRNPGLDLPPPRSVT